MLFLNALPIAKVTATVSESETFRVHARIRLMKTSNESAKALENLLTRTPERRASKAAEVVKNNRSLLRRAIRRGHSLATIASELKVNKRTLQRHLTLAGIFFRKPRTNSGTVVRPYMRRKPVKK